MIRLLAGQLDRHCDGGVLRDGNDQLWANFLTTLVRYYFALALAPSAHPSRGLALGLATTPMPLLGRMAPLLALSIMTPIDAVNMAPVAAMAEKKHPPAIIRDTLNLPKIVHCTEQPPGIGPSQ